MGYSDEAETTQSVVRYMNIMGLGCELLYNDEEGIPRFTSVDPRESIFILDDTIQGNIKAFIRIYPNADNANIYNLVLYSHIDYTEYQLNRVVGDLKHIKSNSHFFGDVPVILYPNNPEYSGTFEGIISLQNAINTIISDEVNDFESFVDAYLALTGLNATNTDDIARMKQNRILLLGDGTKAEWLIKNVNPAHIEQLKNSIIKKIHEMGSIPDIEHLGSFGTSGVALRFKMIGTEMQASKQERVVYRGLKRRLELLYNILNVTDKSIGVFTDVKIEFERNFVVALDEMDRKRLDMSLVERHILSKETFLQHHKSMTPDEALAELHRVAVETYTDDWGSDTYQYDPEYNVDGRYENDRR